jgi:hypothetical protein
MDRNSQTDKLSPAGKWVILVVLELALLVYLITPFLAFSWSQKPFPGFVVEQTLVVANQHGDGWSGWYAGIRYPQLVTRIDGQFVSSSAEFRKAFEGKAIGQVVNVQTTLPDRSVQTIRSIEMHGFSMSDLLRLFWLPYGVGLAFLVIGVWVFRMRMDTRSGRAFAFTCACVAIILGLLFDLSTTHLGTALWTLAVSQLGASLIGLALVFPEELSPVYRRAALRIFAHTVGLGLGVWGLVALYRLDDPWAYIRAWKYSYYFAAAGMLVFLGMMVFRLRVNRSPVAHQQARIILWGSLLACIPPGAWFLAPLFKITTPFNPLVYLPVMILFPASIAVAILRYKLWDIDVLINRTMVYSALTAILGLVYLGLVLGTEMLFHPFMGQNQLALVISTLTVAALFAPLRNTIQKVIDRRFYRRKYNAEQALAAFSASLREEADLDQLNERLIKVVADTLQPVYVTLWLKTPSSTQEDSGEGAGRGGLSLTIHAPQGRQS